MSDRAAADRDAYCRAPESDSERNTDRNADGDTDSVGNSKRHTHRGTVGHTTTQPDTGSQRHSDPRRNIHADAQRDADVRG